VEITAPLEILEWPLDDDKFDDGSHALDGSFLADENHAPPSVVTMTLSSSVTLFLVVTASRDGGTINSDAIRPVIAFIPCREVSGSHGSEDWIVRTGRAVNVRAVVGECT